MLAVAGWHLEGKREVEEILMKWLRMKMLKMLRSSLGGKVLLVRLGPGQEERRVQCR